MFSYNYLFKIILVGDACVGKSSLLYRFIFNKFMEEYDCTIGVEFGSKTIKVQDKNLKLQCWDTAGQEIFRSITMSYYKNSSIAFVVFDITARTSFKRVDLWLKDVRKANGIRNNDNTSSTHIVLVGMKSDMSHIRQVSFNEATKYAESQGIPYYETSAKNSKNIFPTDFHYTDVDHIFYESSKHVLNKILDGNIDVNAEEYGVKEGIKLNSYREKYKNSKYDKYKKCCKV